MAYWDKIITDIENTLASNNNQDITAEVLRKQLERIIVSHLGANATYAGFATPTSPSVPNPSDAKVFYLASTAGTYVNFGSLVVERGDLVLFSNTTTGSWAKTLVFTADLSAIYADGTTDPTNQPTLLGQTYYNKTDDTLFIAVDRRTSTKSDLLRLENSAPASWKIRYDKDIGLVSSFEQMEGIPLMRASAEQIVYGNELEVEYYGEMPEDREGYKKTLFYGVEPNDTAVATLEMKSPSLYATYAVAGWFEVARAGDIPDVKVLQALTSTLDNIIFKQTENLFNPYINWGGYVNNSGVIGTNAAWATAYVSVKELTSYTILFVTESYSANKIGALVFLDKSKNKISHIDLGLSESGLRNSKLIDVPVGCVEIVFNVRNNSREWYSSSELYEGHSDIPSSYVLPKKLVELESFKSDIDAELNTLRSDIDAELDTLKSSVDAELDTLKSSVDVVDNEIGLIVGDLYSTVNRTMYGGNGNSEFPHSWANNEPTENSGEIVSIDFAEVSLTTKDITFGIAKVYAADDSKFIIDRTFTFTLLAGEKSVKLDNVLLNRGEIFVVSSYNGLIKYDNSTDGYPTFLFNGNAAGALGSQNNKKLTFDVKFNIKENEPNFGGIVDNKSITSVILTGSSLTAGFYQPKGYSWTERLNDMCDLNLANFGNNGNSIEGNINYLAKNSAGARNLKPTYIFWCNSANGTPIGEAGVTSLNNASEVTDSFGATMLLGSEEDYAETPASYEDTYSSYAAQNNLKYSPIISVWRKCTPKNNPYHGFMSGRHSGYRTLSPYLMHLDLLKSLPITESIKMFKVRPTYKGGNPTVEDLVFDDNTRRMKYFTAISSGAADIVDTGNIDNLDNRKYDVPGGLNDGTSITEVANFINGISVQFNKTALLEFILPNVGVTSCSLSFKSSDPLVEVFIAITNNSSTIQDNSPRTFFERLTTVLVDGEINCDIRRILNDIQIYDKVRFLIRGLGDFEISNNPRITNYNGFNKNVKEKKYSYRKYGIEQNPNTAISVDWIMTQVALESFPAEIANYTSYNATKSHAEFSKDGFMEKTIPITNKTGKIAVRVVAQFFKKIATIRFVSTPIANSKYIATTPQVVAYDYDYGALILQIDDNIIRKSIVMQGWNEIYFEIDLNYAKDDISLKIIDDSFVDDSYLNNQILMIHDVSVMSI